VFVQLQQSLQLKLSCRHYASVSYALQNKSLFKNAQNWVSVSDGSRTDNGSELQSVEPTETWIESNQKVDKGIVNSLTHTHVCACTHIQVFVKLSVVSCRQLKVTPCNLLNLSTSHILLTPLFCMNLTSQPLKY